MLGLDAQGGAVDRNKDVILERLAGVATFGLTLEACTLRPATISSPSGFQARVKGCSPTCTSPTLALERMSQNLTMPSVLQLASSFSLMGWNATRSSEVAAVAPGARNSVEFLTLVFSGFQMRSVLSRAPVAIKVPDAFHESVRTKCIDDTPGRP